MLNIYIYIYIYKYITKNKKVNPCVVFFICILNFKRENPKSNFVFICIYFLIILYNFAISFFFYNFLKLGEYYTP